MPAYDYVSLDSHGARHKGVIEADSPRHARQLLRERALTPMSLHETSGRRGASKRGQPKAGLREVSLLTRQFATLVEAGLPVEQALLALSRQNENPHVRSMLTAIRSHVKEGHSLAAALALFPSSFNALYCSSIEAGERTGHLEKVLHYLAQFTENALQARQKVLLALLYPAVLTAVSLMIIVFLLTYIVPGMIKVFASTDHALPFLTRALIASSDLVQHYGLLIVLAAAGLFLFMRHQFTRPEIRLRYDQHLLRLPLIGPLALSYTVARFASTLGMLQESGVPLVQGLEIAAAVMQNRYMREQVLAVRKDVSEGVSLARALEENGQFPPVLVTMAASGEASGQLGDMLVRAGAMTQRDVENRTAVLLGLFEPLVLLVMGGIVLLLVLAIILPILNLNQLVQ